ncbi:MAG: copper-containing nitrite reductase [Gallionellaceae bacterium]
MKVKGIIGALSLGLLTLGSSASWAADVAATAPVSIAGAVDIHQDPTAVGTPVGKRGATTVKLALEAVELEGILDPAKKTTFTYWTYNSKVPGPMLRARVGDTIEVTLANRKDSTVTHNVDLHAVWGQGGGAAATVVAPGESKSFVFKAMNPGLYVYHCATPIIPQHISSGMYGLILIEPAGGLPKVDKEFYMMQGEIYTDGAATGHRSFDVPSLLAEHPTDVVINGSRMALANNPMKVKVGDNVRVFFGVGGPNLTSAFHAIGTVFDKVYPEAATNKEPHFNVQTTVVPPGGATMVEFNARVPAKYIFVDHALSRFAKGNAAIMVAEGDQVPDVFRTGKLDAAKK